MLSKVKVNIPYDRSFASNKKSKMWSKSNNIGSDEVYLSCSSKKYLFDCNKCDHKFENTPVNMTNNKN